MADGYPAVGPEDSASQTGGVSRVSGTSSARARAEAEKRALIARAKYCRREAELRTAQQRLDEELRQLQLTALIEAASAREEVFAEYEAADVRPSSRLSDRQPPPVADIQFGRQSQMNPTGGIVPPTATEFDHEAASVQPSSRLSDRQPPPVADIQFGRHSQMNLTRAAEFDHEAADVQPSLRLSDRQPPPATDTQFGRHSQMNLTRAAEFDPVSRSAVLMNPESLPMNAGIATHEVCPPAQPVFHGQNFGMDSVVSTNNISELIATLKLPQSQMMKFDGDPMKYWTFIRTFDNCIGDVAVDAATKFNRLQQYCTGKALKVIECCSVMEPELAYQRARQLLRSRFGNEYQISECWIQKIVGGVAVKAGDGAGLQELADDARMCKETLEAMGMLDEIDTRAKMVKIVNRLPLYLQAKWRHLAIKHLDCKTKYPRFVQLVDFLEQASRELNDPVFGCAATGNQKDRGKAQGISLLANGDRGRHATATGELRSQHGTSDFSKVSRTCYHCFGGHLLIACQKFKQMNPTGRLEAVKRLRLCFNCLGSRNHVAKKCLKQDRCDVSGCNMKHSRLLHDALVSSRMQTNTSSDSTNSSQTVQAQSCACGPVGASKVALPIVAVTVRGSGMQTTLHTAALLDPGSNKSFCSVELVKKLGLSGEHVNLSLSTISESSKPEAVEVSLEVTAATGGRKSRKAITLPKVYALETFPSLAESIALRSDMAQWNHLKGLDFGECQDVSILIGQDASQALMPLEVRRGKDHEPYAVRTALGWTVNGFMSEETGSINALCSFICGSQSIEPNLEAQVQQFWKLDSGDVTDSELQLSVNDKKVIDLWEQSVTKIDGHYQLDIPFVSNPPELPNNRALAECRLKCLARRLDRDPELHRRYTAEIGNLISAGYAEHVSPDENEGSAGKTWYLPHHSVTNPNKPGKVRIVFDCSAQHAGTSLNKRVLQGPDLTNKLLGVLTRFREQQIAVTADIEAMFHQVQVPVKDRNVLRFLWWPDGNLTVPPDVYRMTVHLFGGIWSPSCASFALRRTADENRDDFDLETIQTVKDNFYVDDCLKSTDSEAKAIQLVEQSSELLARGGFRLTKWVSNSRRVLATIPIAERAADCRDVSIDRGCLPTGRALGIIWNAETDRFSIKVRLDSKQQTKRGVLSTLSSVYDPLGFVCPYILQAKLIFQNECKLSKEWDKELDDQNARKWKQWQADLSILEEFEVERCVVPADFGTVKSYQLHHFCDASFDAYGTVSYLRSVNEDGRIHCALVLGKSKLAPLKPLTVPRLELLAAVLAAKVDSLLRHEIKLSLKKSVFWTDSTTVLQYIASSVGRFKTFVANRLNVIQEATTVEQWKFVSSKMNPADDASRGLRAGELLNNKRWKNGPQFLWTDSSHWPVRPGEARSELDNDCELKLAMKSHATVSLKSDVIDELFNHYSSWFRLQRAVAWLRKFLAWIRCGKDVVRRSQNVKCSLDTDEVKAASMVIIKRVQLKCYDAEVQSLKSGAKSVSRSSSIYKLEPFLDDDGLLRVSGRLQSAPIADSAKHPIIVPRDHHVTSLIVRQVHEVECRHSGREYTLSVLRRHYWVPRARVLIAKIIRGCVLCKRLKGTVAVQRMADLPVDRVTPDKPAFTNVGIDCFGPFQVKRGRSHEKRYGCLFTCLVTRAIHIEKLHSLDADAFLNAFVRFVSRRGMPEIIRSDNGTNFLGGERELVGCIAKWNNDHRLANHLLLKDVKWIFNPPTASHMGGAWERLIRSVRRSLEAILKGQVLDDERLDTVFCEVESIVNGRPLTPVSDDPNELEALTPNHLLLLRPGLCGPLGEFTTKDTYRRRWRHVQYLADQFWKRWIDEYLPTLQLRRKWLESLKNVRVGDIVLVAQENTPRKNWPLGRITATFHGRDGLVRSAELKTANSYLTRPVNKLCLLEGVVLD